jgi:hypothetical protein
MKAYTVSAQERDGDERVTLKRAKVSKDEAMQAAWNFSQHATLCDVVLTCGSKHVVTYRKGRITALNGKGVKL